MGKNSKEQRRREESGNLQIGVGIKPLIGLAAYIAIKNYSQISKSRIEAYLLKEGIKNMYTLEQWDDIVSRIN